MPCLLCYHNDCYIEIAGLTLRKSGLLPLTSTGKPVFVYFIMITIFLENCNRISQSFYDSVIFDLPFHQLTCSCSHSACLSIHGYYRRNVKLPSGTIRLRVCRVKCSECGTTHALLLSSMVPYSQISFSDQQMICYYYEKGQDASEICERNPSIDENNVKAVLRNYRRHWREKLCALKIHLFPPDDLIQSCFSNYSSQFMQIHRRINKLFSFTT